MKKNYYVLTIVLFTLLIIGSVSCSSDDDNRSAPYSQFTALFNKTDYYVNKLKTYKSLVESEKTTDYKYTVSVIGRLITVKKNDYTGEPYSTIKDALKYHYRDNYSVNDVFLNNAGTITIDCRR